MPLLLSITANDGSAVAGGGGGTVISTVAGIAVAVIVIGLVCLLWLYYRRREANLKTEMAHVKYIAEQQGFGGNTIIDRNHFDNPVYSYGSPPKRDDESNLLNNTNIIRNNLKQTNTILERQRMGLPCCSTDGDDFSSKGYCGSETNSLKNKNADATNPNLYQGIDHVYDEIKQKDVSDLDTEYDHLDYSRPSSAWKPHYQRMPNTFGSRDLSKNSSDDASTITKDSDKSDIV